MNCKKLITVMMNCKKSKSRNQSNSLIINILLVFSIILLFPYLTKAQLKQITATASKTTTSQAAFSNILNAPAKRDVVKRELVTITSGTKQIGMSNNSNQISYADIMAKEKMNIFYGVPIRVALDRNLLQINIQERLAELIDVKTIWEYSGESKKKEILYNYVWKKGSISEEELNKVLNRRTIPDEVAQQMVKIFQDQINQLQEISDNLYYNCPPVELKKMAATVNADVRFHNPVSDALGFMRANGSGSVNTSALFENIPYSTLDGNPISGTLLIYKK